MVAVASTRRCDSDGFAEGLRFGEDVTALVPTDSREGKFLLDLCHLVMTGRQLQLQSNIRCVKGEKTATLMYTHKRKDIRQGN